MSALTPYMREDPLTEKEATIAIGVIMDGGVPDIDVAEFLTLLAKRGETVAEIVGAAKALRARALGIAAPPGALDCCGTGGDGAHSLNISTAVALVVAGAGVTVAKHGGRAASSRCGAADVLEALGVRLDISKESQEQALREIGFAFLFAPHHHTAMAKVAPVRKALGFRTIFNLIGPLANPAGVRHHLLGVFDSKWCLPMAQALLALGAKAAWVVHGAGGFDEISLCGPTHMTKIEGQSVVEAVLTPADFGLPSHSKEALIGGDATHNARALLGLLEGATGAYRDCVLANAAAALVIAGKAPNVVAGVMLATQAIDTGAAHKIFSRYKEIYTHNTL